MNRTTRGSIFVPEKVFEGVHSRAMKLLRKSEFGPDCYFESGPKFQIRTIEKWTILTRDHHFDPDHVSAILVRFSIVRICYFGPDSK